MSLGIFDPKAIRATQSPEKIAVNKQLPNKQKEVNEIPEKKSFKPLYDENGNMNINDLSKQLEEATEEEEVDDELLSDIKEGIDEYLKRKYEQQE
jgi:hypothetical protein